MIALNDYANLFMRLIKGQVGEMMAAIKNGTDPDEYFADRDRVGELINTLWTVCQPDTECHQLDLTDRIRALPGDYDIQLAGLFVAFDATTREPLVIYVDGYGEDKPLDGSRLQAQLTEMMRHILIDELNLDAERTIQMIGEQHSCLDEAFNKTFTPAEQAKIDQEVAQWREEIDTKIDSLFKKGGST